MGVEGGGVHGECGCVMSTGTWAEEVRHPLSLSEPHTSESAEESNLGVG